MTIAKCIRSILMRNSRFMLTLLAVLFTSPLLAAPQFYDLQDERPVTRLFQESGFGYSIRYPQDWIYTKPSQYTVIFSGKEGTEGYYSTVTIQNLASTAIGGKYINLNSVVDDLKNQLKKGAQNVTIYDEQPFIYVKEWLKLEGREFKAEYLRQGEKFRQWVIVIPRKNKEIFHAWFYTSPVNQYEKYLNVSRFVLSSWAIEDKPESTLEKPLHPVAEKEEGKKFVHPKLGFNLVIPKGWREKEKKTADGEIEIEAVEGQAEFFVFMKEHVKRALMVNVQDFEKEIVGEGKSYQKKLKGREFVLNGEEAYEGVYEGKEGTAIKIVFVKKAERVYMLFAQCIALEFSRWEPMFDRIVAGFRFEKEAKTSDAEKPPKSGITKEPTGSAQRPASVPSEDWAPAMTARIYDVTTARDVAWGQPIGPSDVFSPDVNPIYVWFRHQGLAVGTTITAVWYFTSTVTPTKIGEGSVKVTPPSDWGQFNFELAQGKRWPAGDYRVELLVAGQSAAEARFRVATDVVGTPMPPAPTVAKTPPPSPQGDWRDAINKQNVEAAKKLRAEGEALQKQGKIEAAIEKYQLAQRYYPDSRLADHITSLQKATQKPKFDLEGPPEGFREELALIEKLKKDPSRANMEALAEARYQYALTLTQMATKKNDGDAYKLAFLYAQSATDLSPDNADYWSFLGQLYENLGDDALNEIMAEDALQKAVELNPKNDRFRLLLGQSFYRHGNFSFALEQFETVLRRDPRLLSPSLISTMCSAYVLDSQYSRGVKFFREILEKQPGADSARLALAILLHQQKDSLRATEELNRIIKKADTSEENRKYALSLLEEWKKAEVKP